MSDYDENRTRTDYGERITSAIEGIAQAQIAQAKAAQKMAREAEKQGKHSRFWSNITKTTIGVGIAGALYLNFNNAADNGEQDYLQNQTPGAYQNGSSSTFGAPSATSNGNNPALYIEPGAEHDNIPGHTHEQDDDATFEGSNRDLEWVEDLEENSPEEAEIKSEYPELNAF